MKHYLSIAESLQQQKLITIYWKADRVSAIHQLYRSRFVHVSMRMSWYDHFSVSIVWYIGTYVTTSGSAALAQELVSYDAGLKHWLQSSLLFLGTFSVPAFLNLTSVFLCYQHLCCIDGGQPVKPLKMLLLTWYHWWRYTLYPAGHLVTTWTWIQIDIAATKEQLHCNRYPLREKGHVQLQVANVQVQSMHEIEHLESSRPPSTDPSASWVLMLCDRAAELPLSILGESRCCH